MQKSMKKVIGCMLAVTMILLSLPAYATAPFEGAGTAQDPYKISTTADLVKLAELTNTEDTTYSSAHYILTNDLDMTGVEFSGICEMEVHNQDGSLGYTTSYAKFTGTFDGDNHIIKNLTVDRSDNTEYNNTYAGLFCWTDEGAVIKNLGLVNADITSGKQGKAGGFVGRATGTITIENCFVRGIRVVSPSANDVYPCGAMAAQLVGGTMTNCYAVGITGSVASSITGSGTYPTVTNFYTTGYISDANISANTNVLRNIGSADAAAIEAFITASNGAFVADKNNANSGYPILLWESDFASVSFVDGNVVVNNNSEDLLEGILIVAAYDDTETMLDICVWKDDLSVVANDYDEIPYSEVTGATIYRAFIWNDMQDMTSLCLPAQR